MSHTPHHQAAAAAPRRLAALAALLLASLVPLGALLAWAPPAQAHAALISADPADGERVAALPAEVTLEFNETVADPAYVVVTAPDGVRVNSGDAAVDGTRVTQALDAQGLALPAGDYTLAYRVVSADGHPITGEQTFEVTTPTEATGDTGTAGGTGTAETGDASAVDADSDADDGLDGATALMVAGVVALLVAGGALLLRARGRA